MVIFNFVGLAMLIVGYVVANVLGLAIGMTSENVLLVIAGPLLFFADMLYRWNRPAGPAWTVAAQAERAQWWYSPRHGGHVVFVPIWIYGLVGMFVGTYGLLT